MRFLRREPDPPTDFWGWWGTARDRIAAAIEGRALDDGIVREITAGVHAIHPEMAWELAPGRTAQHAFCISPEGRADLRIVALRWLDTAPPADATWEYHASKQASERLTTLQIGSTRFDLDETRAITSWDASRHRVDVRLWHPGFEHAPTPVRTQVGFLFLDNLLGEDDVERWIGSIDLLESPTGGRTPAELRAEIDRHRSEPAGDDRWVLGTLTAPEGPVIVLADAALKRIDHPFADRHIAISEAIPGGRMPDDGEAARLNAEEDDLVARFDGVAVYAGRTTKPGLRTMHFIAEDIDRVKAVIDAWAGAIPDPPGGEPRKVKVNLERDTNWIFRRRDLGIG